MRMSLTGLCWVGIVLLTLACRADEENPQPVVKKKAPLATFLTVTSPVEDVMSGRVKSAALALQHQAGQEQRRAVFVLEISPGSSEFHHIQGLAKFLTSAEMSSVKTVAWIPEKVTGNNVVLALACQEIIMHPDAELGDIGRGKALEADEEQAVINLVEKRTNAKVNRALAIAMMDPQAVALKIKLKVPGGADNATESRIVTQDELQRLRDNKAAILDVETVKEAGEIGTFTGSRARLLDILVVQTLEHRSDIADLYGLPHESLREDPTAGETPRVQLIKIDGIIDPLLEAFLERQIKRSVADGANLLIFEIDSPGGYLQSSTNLAHAIASLDSRQVRTVAYVPREALSGAAIIALGCDEIYLHPTARFGDAGPIEIRPGGPFERAPEKVLSTLKETLRTLADEKGRPPALAEAMADMNLEVFTVTHRDTGRVWYMSDDEIHGSNGEWIKGRAVHETRENLLLTVNGKRAHELKLAEPPVESIDELRQNLGVPPTVKLVPAGPTWVDTLVFILNMKTATFLLFIAGAVLIYLELYTLTGLFGIGSAVCFSLFFWSRFLGGTAGWLEVTLFLLGLILIALEIFVIPGFGVFGVSGGLLVIGSLILASQTFIVPQGGGQFGQMTGTMGTLMASILSVIVLAIVMSRFLPSLPILNHMVLSPPTADGAPASEPRLRPASSSSLHPGNPSDLVGQTGTASSILRPSGKAQIADRFVDVVSDGPYIPQGSRIEVVEVNGNRIVVRQSDV